MLLDAGHGRVGNWSTQSKDLSMLTGAFSASTRRVQGNTALGLLLFWGSMPSLMWKAQTRLRGQDAAVAAADAVKPGAAPGAGDMIARVAAAAVTAAVAAGMATVARGYDMAIAPETLAPETAVRKEARVPRKKRSVSGPTAKVPATSTAATHARRTPKLEVKGHEGAPRAGETIRVVAAAAVAAAVAAAAVGSASMTAPGTLAPEAAVRKGAPKKEARVPRKKRSISGSTAKVPATATAGTGKLK